MFAELFGALSLLTPETLFLMVLALVGGLVVGAIPGLTAVMAVALMVPMTYTLSMELAIALLVAVYVGGISGGCVAASLLNIPGTPASITTTFDAYPMAARGEAGKALAYGMFSSFMGTIISFIPLALFAQLMGGFAMYINAYEYLALVAFTLTCVIAISGKSLVKGLIAAFIGLFMSIVGLSATDSIARFTFGFSNLESGLSMMPVLIGMYGVTQVLNEVKNINQPFSLINPRFSFAEYASVARKVVGSTKNLIRSSFLGVAVGMLPGIGTNVASILSYTQAKSAAKDPDSFGKGNPDGIIASEAANNSCCGGALVPLLTLGIPGDGATLMMLGAFMIHGIQPGPILMRNHMDIVASVVLFFLVTAILLLLVQVIFIRVLIKSLLIPRYILYPIIVVMCATGCFALNSNMFDVWIFAAMGLGGVILQKLDFPLLPLVLGLILGQMTEINLDACWSIGDGSLWAVFDRPVAIVFFILALLSLAYSLYKRSKSTAEHVNV